MRITSPYVLCFICTYMHAVYFRVSISTPHRILPASHIAYIIQSLQHTLSHTSPLSLSTAWSGLTHWLISRNEEGVTIRATRTSSCPSENSWGWVSTFHMHRNCYYHCLLSSSSWHNAYLSASSNCTHTNLDESQWDQFFFRYSLSLQPIWFSSDPSIFCFSQVSITHYWLYSSILLRIIIILINITAIHLLILFLLISHSNSHLIFFLFQCLLKIGEEQNPRIELGDAFLTLLQIMKK